MKFLLLFIQALFLSSIAIAQTDLDLPVDLELTKMGYPEAPVIQCPRPQKKYEDILAQLNGIQEKIKREACPQAKINAIHSEVQSLENLITNSRKNFIDLIKKGTSGEGQLTDKEVETVQKYVDQVVKKVAVVTGLVNNPACFDDGEKVSTLSFLSSIISEVSGAVGALSGPFGAKISLGGKLASGLLSSLDTIVQANKTYDYSRFEDQKNYLHNLCAYYDFKNDLDKETDTFAYYDRLIELKETTDTLLDKLSRDCADCKVAIDDYIQRMEANVPLLVSENVVLEELVVGAESVPLEFSAFDDDRTLAFEAPAEPVAIAEESLAGPLEVPPLEMPVARSQRDLSDRELAAAYFLQSFNEPIVVAEPAPVEEGGEDEDDDGLAFEAPEEPVVVADPPRPAVDFDPSLESGERSIGLDPFLTPSQELTIKALQTKGWVESEIEELEKNDTEGLAEDGRLEVREVQADIERFLVDREGVRYVDYYGKAVYGNFRQLENSLRGIQMRFYHMRLQPDPNYNYQDKDINDLSQVVHDIFRDDLEFADILIKSMQSDEITKEINNIKKEIRRSLEPIKGSYSILTRRCQFFSKSLFRDNQSTARACERALRKAADVTDFFKDLKGTSFAARYASLLKFVDEEDKRYAADWLSSSTAFLEIYSKNL